MTDIKTAKERSLNMSRVKSKDTQLEIKIRKWLHKNGFRYKLTNKLPGKPDLVFPKHKSIVFINGCFWHNHGCKQSNLPQTNRDFWKNKLEGNKKRDKNNIAKLKAVGWNVFVIWQCKTRNKYKFEQTMVEISNKINTY